MGTQPEKNADDRSIREALAQYEAMIGAFDGLIYVCSDDFKVEFANKQMIERTGYDPIGQPCFKALHNRESICPWCVNESVQQGKTVRWEVQSPKDNRWYHNTNVPIRRPDGRISKMAMIRDITEQKVAEESFRRREAVLNAVSYAAEQFLKTTAWEQHIQEVLSRLGHATEVSRVCLYENRHRPDGGTLTDLRYEWVASGFTRQLYNPNRRDIHLESVGYSRWTENLGRGRVIFGDVQDFPECEQKRFTEQEVISLAAVSVHVDQDWWGFIVFEDCKAKRAWPIAEIDALKAAGNILGAAIHRKRSEETLRNREAKLSSLFRAAPIGIAVVTNRILQEVNQRVCDISGYSAQELVGQSTRLLYPTQEDFDYVGRENYRKLPPKGTATSEVHWKRKDGRIIDVQLCSTCIVPGDPSSAVMFTVQDITERKQAEELIRRERNMYVKGPVTVFKWKADENWPVEYVSPNITQFGYSPEVFTSGNLLFADIIHPEDLDRVAAEVRQHSQSDATSFEQQYRINCPDGSTRWLYDYTVILRDPQGRITHYQGYILDRTAYQQAEELLHRLSSAIRQTADSLIITNRHGVIEYVNPAFEELTGYAAAEAIGRTPALLKSGHHSDEFYQRMWKTLLSGKTFRTEFVNKRKDGMLYFQGETITPIKNPKEEITHFVSTGRDITEMKRVEEEVKRLAAFPQFNPNPILEFDTQGELLYSNQAAQNLAQKLVKGPIEAMLPQDANAIARDCLQKNAIRKNVEITCGNQTLSWSFFPVAAIGKVHAYGVDITDRLNMENQLRQLQKMDAVGRLAGGIAHDFNNILTAMLGYTEVLLATPGLSSEIAESLQEISNAANRAAGLTRQLLTFSRRQVLQPKVLNLNDVINNLTQMLRRIIREDIVLNIQLAPELPSIHADEVMMEQILINLAVNAKDAMSQGGQLTISTQAVHIDREYQFTNPEAQGGFYVCLSVSDTGCGMDEATRANLFEPFFTTKETSKGTGLGLATVYGIVKQHSGWIEAVSQVSQGTTFKVYLPGYDKPAEPKQRKSLVGQRVKGGTETILLVEDEQAVRLLTKSTLISCGYTIVEAASGVEAMSLWNRIKDGIQLLLTDVVMPGGLTGLELAAKLQEQKPSLKILFMSGYNVDVVEHSNAFRPGVAFLPKPFTPERLAQAVRNCLDGIKEPA